MIISHVWQPTTEKLSLFAGVRGFHFMRCTRKMATHGRWFLSNDFEGLTIRGKATGREVIRAVYKKYIPVAHWQKPVNGLKGAASESLKCSSQMKICHRFPDGLSHWHSGTGSGFFELPLKAMGLRAHVEYASGANKLKIDDKLEELGYTNKEASGI